MAQEGAAGAAEPLQAEQRAHGAAGGADPAAPGSEHGHAESAEEPGGRPHGRKHIVSKSMLLFCHKNVNLYVCTYKNI